jgi:hypothetical protein
MIIRFSEEHGTITIDGVVISAGVLRELVDPDRRLLFRFERKDGLIQATAYSESQVIWLDSPETITDQTTDFGVLKQTEDRRGAAE